MGEFNPWARDSNSAMPDIYRVKGQYLDSYYNFINNATSYKLGKHEARSLVRCRGAVISLFYKLEWELSDAERAKIKKADLNKFKDLEGVFEILAKKLKQLKITDLKMRPAMGGGFR